MTTEARAANMRVLAVRSAQRGSKVLLNPQDVIWLVDLLHRGEMTPSERQSYLSESVEESVEPERALFAMARRHIIDDLIDNASLRWWAEEAQRRGLDVGWVMDLLQALVARLRTTGRLLPNDLMKQLHEEAGQ